MSLPIRLKRNVADNETGPSEDTYSRLENDSNQQGDQLPDHESNEDDESQATDSTMDSDDDDSEDGE
jgi:hypothetical protein